MRQIKLTLPSLPQWPHALEETEKYPTDFTYSMRQKYISFLTPAVIIQGHEAYTRFD